jgi:hypothetical protein
LVPNRAACRSDCDAFHLGSTAAEPRETLKEPNGRTPAKLTRSGTSARSTHDYRTYDRIMTDM